QKGRRDPAIALFKLARANIESYPLTYYSLELRQVSGLAESWIARLRSGSDAALSIEPKDWPRLDLIPG
ncbi:MAG TPA: hypothetical protein VKY92_26360, partial [Verrucomicrobiae bacterium]|nr:hypothetical protein [Verrucomicrobiae bacterium]